MQNTVNYTKKYSRLALLLAFIFIIKMGLQSCEPECYENHEPEVYLVINNSCLYKQITAKGIIEPIKIENDCAENKGTATITLPLLETQKTYYLTDGSNIIDSFIFNYQLSEHYQGKNCGYVVILNNLYIDTINSSIPFSHLFYENRNDSIHPYINYSSFADYMRLYW